MTILDILLNIWRPALEVIILAVGIYYALMFVRGTRGWPVVLGFLFLLLVISLVTTALDLRVLFWLLAKLLTGLAIAVLVIFQPELRRMLAELGNLPLFASARDTRENIEVIIQTAERLSDVKIGALIALEQSIQLDDAVESGVVVDCEATPEMLETIFFPNNAIHDGGVIIRGDRIAKAACIFPLTRRQDLNPSLGTRHRAAIGLAEETVDRRKRIRLHQAAWRWLETADAPRLPVRFDLVVVEPGHRPDGEPVVRHHRAAF